MNSSNIKILDIMTNKIPVKYKADFRKEIPVKKLYVNTRNTNIPIINPHEGNRVSILYFVLFSFSSKN